MMDRLRTVTTFNRQQFIAVAGGVTAIGIVAVVLSFAAGAPIAFEPETGTLAAGATVTSVTGQSGTGAVKFAAATPTPTPGACAGAANTPGGPDPWGGCFPGPNNTGVPAGITLTSYTGPMTITAANTVIDSKNITGTLQIATSGVMIKNSKISGRIALDYSAPNAANFYMTIQDSEIIGGPINPNDYNFDVGMANFTLLRSNIHGGGLGVECEKNCTIQDNYVYGLATDPAGVAHEGAMRAGEEVNTIHNSLQCLVGNDGCSGNYTGYPDFGPIQNNLIQRNLIMMTSGGICAYGGSTASKPYSGQTKNMRFIQNIFQKGTRPGDHGQFSCGYYSAVGDYDANAPGNQATGNLFDDGTQVPF